MFLSMLSLRTINRYSTWIILNSTSSIDGYPKEEIAKYNFLQFLYGWLRVKDRFLMCNYNSAM